MIKYDLNILDEMAPEQLIMELHPHIQRALNNIDIAYFNKDRHKLDLILNLNGLYHNISTNKKREIK